MELEIIFFKVKRMKFSSCPRYLNVQTKWNLWKSCFNLPFQMWAWASLSLGYRNSVYLCFSFLHNKWYISHQCLELFILWCKLWLGKQPEILNRLERKVFPFIKFRGTLDEEPWGSTRFFDNEEWSSVAPLTINCMHDWPPPPSPHNCMNELGDGRQSQQIVVLCL